MIGQPSESHVPWGGRIEGGGIEEGGRREGEKEEGRRKFSFWLGVCTVLHSGTGVSVPLEAAWFCKPFLVCRGERKREMESNSKSGDNKEVTMQKRHLCSHGLGIEAF